MSLGGTSSVTLSRAAVRTWVCAALLVGALVRLPGVFWGFNWPGASGFAGHHPDEWSHVVNAEVVMNPREPPRYDHPYPMALGAIVGAPLLFGSIVKGHFGATRPDARWTILAGRLVVVLFALGSILVVYLIGRDVLGDARVGIAAAWLLALGGLHVTQSHFFLSDVPVTTLLLLSLWLLWRDAMAPPADRGEWLRWGAFSTGVAFALKLFFFSIPTLGLVILLRGPRIRRLLHAAVFGVAGMFVAMLGFDNLKTLAAILGGGTNDPYVFGRTKGALLYLVELPDIFSLPLLLLALLGMAGIARRAVRHPERFRVGVGLLLFAFPPLLLLLFIIFKLDHFPRHWVPLIAWAALAGGWMLIRAIDAMWKRRLAPALLLTPVFAWMLAFIVDTERLFIVEPRNAALRWVQANVAPGSSIYWSRHSAPVGYVNLRWQDKGNPDILVIEMYDANNFISGIDWKYSYPSNPIEVFDVESPERLAAFQSLFKGTSTYREVQRFSEGYFMPERWLAMRFVGDRAARYVTELVLFRRVGSAAGTVSVPRVLP